MKVLADYHHGDLYYSLHLLFEKRLGWELYRPIGMEWFEAGYWQLAAPYNHALDTVRQYLEVGYRAENTWALNDPAYQEEGVLYFKDHTRPDYYQRGTPLNRDVQYDIVLSSVPYQVPAFLRYGRERQPQAKHIFQVGNNFQGLDFADIQNVLASAIIHTPPHVNTVVYHQEFRTDIFCQQSSRLSECRMTSFINVIQHKPSYREFHQLASMLPGWSCESYGAATTGGALNPHERIVEEMARSKFIWHVKEGGDGYGHILHNIYAIGRPAIVRSSYYRGQLGERLFSHMENCIDLDRMSLSAAAEFMRDIETSRYDDMCQAARDRFEEQCDFDAEFVQIRDFMERLK